MANLIGMMRNKSSELLGCDANLHYVGCGSANINTSGETLNDFIMSEDLIILEKGSEITFTDSRRHEVLGITIGSAGLSSCVKNWKFMKEPSGSDHRQIRMNLTRKVKRPQ